MRRLASVHGRLTVSQHAPSGMFARLLLGYVLALALAVIVPDASRPPVPEGTPIPVVLVLRWILCTVFVWSIEPVLRASAASATLARAFALGRQHPRTAVALAALAGTLLSAYPVVLLGQSLVSPFIAGTPLLYNQPPFAPGYGALESIEDSAAPMLGRSSGRTCRIRACSARHLPAESGRCGTATTPQGGRCGERDSRFPSIRFTG